MLFAINTNSYIEDIPHKRDFDRWRSRLTDAEYVAIAAALNELIDNTPRGQQILTSSWIPGSDWSGTVYEPIYLKACDQNPDESGLCFGLFLWAILMNRGETWAFGRYEKDGVPIRGLTYFVLENPPPRNRR